MSSNSCRSSGSSRRPSRVTCPHLISMKQHGRPIAAITAYDYPMAVLADTAGLEFVLVGDSSASVTMGHETTIPIGLDELEMNLRAVRRGVRRALLVADLPFGYCHEESACVTAAVRFLKSGAEAVKLEGGRKRCSLVRRLVDAEIPVMGHIGLTPQSVHVMGGYRVQGKTSNHAETLLNDALALEKAGVFALVLEGIPAEVATRISSQLKIPTIGIGAGDGCDGQILVLHDLLGLTAPTPSELASWPLEPDEAPQGRKPRFVREYLDLRTMIFEALKRYTADVRERRFPSDAESYRLSEAESVKVHG